MFFVGNLYGVASVRLHYQMPNLSKTAVTLLMLPVGLPTVRCRGISTCPATSIVITSCRASQSSICLQIVNHGKNVFENVTPPPAYIYTWCRQCILSQFYWATKGRHLCLLFTSMTKWWLIRKHLLVCFWTECHGISWHYIIMYSWKCCSQPSVRTLY